MSIKSVALGLLTALSLGLAAVAQDISVQDAYAISTGVNAQTGAAFMAIVNHGAVDDALVDVRSVAARLVELHSHTMASNGVMSMGKVTAPVPLPAGGTILLERGGYHIMFMGLTAPFEQGQIIPVTLVFERAGEIVVEIPVDLARLTEDMQMPMAGAVAGE